MSWRYILCPGISGSKHKARVCVRFLTAPAVGPLPASGEKSTPAPRIMDQEGLGTDDSWLGETTPQRRLRPRRGNSSDAQAGARMGRIGASGAQERPRLAATTGQHAKIRCLRSSTSPSRAKLAPVTCDLPYVPTSPTLTELQWLETPSPARRQIWLEGRRLRNDAGQYANLNIRNQMQ